MDPTTPTGLEAILGVTRRAAREAATLALGGFRRAPAVEHKGAVDLVTEFDRASEDLLRHRLGEALPFAIVGEERGGTGDGPTFYIDPIDGTTNFVHGHPFWCVSIGLAIEGAPVLGVVLAPALGLEWSAWLAASGERRAVRRSAESALAVAAPRVVEDPCAVSATSSLSEALLATGFPYDLRTSADDNFDAFVAIHRRCQGVRRCGSAALDLCLVADGTFDGYWERKLRPWDLAAGVALVRAAGGRVTSFEGAEASVHDRHLVATNGAVHESLLSALAQVDGAARSSSQPHA